MTESLLEPQQTGSSCETSFDNVSLNKKLTPVKLLFFKFTKCSWMHHVTLAELGVFTWENTVNVQEIL